MLLRLLFDSKDITRHVEWSLTDQQGRAQGQDFRGDTLPTEKLNNVQQEVWDAIRERGLVIEMNKGGYLSVDVSAIQADQS